jgi:tryptophan halogenase
MKKQKIIVVGGGTAGAIASTYLKKCYGDSAEIVLIYDHKNPNIGIGESLTPTIYNYLRFLEIKREDLIKNVNATVKLGIKFKNWLNRQDEFFHAFLHKQLVGNFVQNFEASYDIVNEIYDHDIAYGKQFFLHNRIPQGIDDIQSLHINGELFSKFIIEKFKKNLTIIDDIVIDAIKDINGNITNLILEKNGKIQGDFFIDASGFGAIIFKNLPNTWIDKSDWLPLNSCIPNPINHQLTEFPVYTTAEASDQGWILQVPLSNRWGCGYLYSDNFISDDLAISKFDDFLNKNYKTSLMHNKIIRFKSGYWENQWVGNCLAIGLASGFSEPLEATNIHQAIFQLEKFVSLYNFQIFNLDRKEYNRTMRSFYERVYLFLRFCYCTERTDSEFWKYMTNCKPMEIAEFEEKISKNIMNTYSMTDDIFNYDNFTKIAYGLGKIDKKEYKNNLINKNVYELAEKNSRIIRQFKNQEFQKSIDHSFLIKRVLDKDYS